MGLQEPNLDKWTKIGKLELQDDEWDRVKLFLDLLTKHYIKHGARDLQDRSMPASKHPLQAAIDKIVVYYEKTGGSDAYIMAMLLDLNEKMNHFKKYWDENLQKEACEHAKHIFQEYYVRIHGDAEHVAPMRKGRGSGTKVTQLLRELSDDDTEDDDDNISAPSAAASSIDPYKPWLQDFNYYAWASAQAQPSPSPMSGLGQNIRKPIPSQAQAQAWPAHHY
ncbi:hypothetical protein BDR03DRAFT_984194 [Suillus americanus]|nr:hypothetical protein BDR03DRAFT_984194 [Suillus americanus]